MLKQYNWGINVWCTIYNGFLNISHCVSFHKLKCYIKKIGLFPRTWYCSTFNMAELWNKFTLEVETFVYCKVSRVITGSMQHSIRFGINFWLSHVIKYIEFQNSVIKKVKNGWLLIKWTKVLQFKVGEWGFFSYWYKKMEMLFVWGGSVCLLGCWFVCWGFFNMHKTPEVYFQHLIYN